MSGPVPTPPVPPTTTVMPGAAARIAAAAFVSSAPYDAADGVGAQNWSKFGSFQTSRASTLPE